MFIPCVGMIGLVFVTVLKVVPFFLIRACALGSLNNPLCFTADFFENQTINYPRLVFRMKSEIQGHKFKKKSPH